jgi:hypothetical protein
MKHLHDMITRRSDFALASGYGPEPVKAEPVPVPDIGRIEDKLGDVLTLLRDVMDRLAMIEAHMAVITLPSPKQLPPVPPAPCGIPAQPVFLTTPPQLIGQFTIR